MATLGELYEAEELARIEAGPRDRRRVARGRDHPVASGALVMAIGLGFAEAFDPAPTRPVVEEVDPSGADENQRIRLTGMEFGPRHTVAWVRW